MKIFLGEVESLSFDGLRGWVIEKSSPAAPVQVEILMDGEVIGETSSFRGNRSTLEPANAAALRCLAQFSFPLHAALFDGKTHEFAARVKETGYVLPGSGMPIRLNAANRAIDPHERGGSMTIGEHWITGWAVERGCDTPLAAELRIDGKFHSSVLAGGYGEDLENDPGFDFENRHIRFSIPTPEILLDGFRHRVCVHVSEWGEQQLPQMSADYCHGNILGSVDHYSSNGATGWLGFREAPRSIGRITVFHDGEAIGHGKLGLERNDIASLGICSNAYSFNLVFAMPKRGEIEIRYGEYVLREGRLTCESYLSEYAGSLDDAARNTISGWIVDKNAPDKTVELRLVIDGQNHGKFTPNTHRPDILRHFPKSNLSGFEISTPALLRDGKRHMVDVFVGDTQIKLGNSGKEACFQAAYTRLPHRDPHPALSTFVPPVPEGFAPGSDQPEVSIVILNRNGGDLLNALFQSFLATNRFPSYEFVIVDHDSSDHSRELIDAWAEKTHITRVYLPYNASFSSSCNLAAGKHAKGDTLLFLNNDIVFVQDVLTEMAAKLKSSPDVGMLGIKLLDVVEDGANDPYPPVQHLGIRFGLFGEGTVLPFEEEFSRDTASVCFREDRTAGVTGAVMMVRREEFLSAGGFHEGYFYGYEDVDLCLAYRIQMGKEILCLNQLQALHHRGYLRLSGREPSVFDNFDRNHEVLMERFGYAIRREYRKSLFAGDGVCTRERLRIAFAVSECGSDATAEDYVKASELARELADIGHIDPVFLSERNDWYDLDDVHVLVVMRHDYDLRAMRNQRADLLPIAWMSDPSAAWEKQKWFDMFGMHLSDSEMARNESSPAQELAGLLRRHAIHGMRIAIKAPGNSAQGEGHFATSLATALRAIGHVVRIDFLPDWEPASRKHVDDVVIVLRGPSEYKPKPEHMNLMWLMSHSENVSLAEMKLYDHIFVASTAYAGHLEQLGLPASPLLLCTDAHRPAVVDRPQAPSHQLIFVGDSPGERHPIVSGLVELGVDVAIYGCGWARFAPANLVRGEMGDHLELSGGYANAGVVFVSHEQDMARHGFLSRHLFDAAACGAYVLSDHAEGLNEAFDGMIPGCRCKDELTRELKRADNKRHRHQTAQRLREFVLARHTFDHRARSLVDVIIALDARHLQSRHNPMYISNLTSAER